MSRLSETAIYPGAPRPLLFAHRGYSRRAPENTLSAFAAAKAAGIPGVELDVHRCASDELVVIHDADLTRVTGDGGTVEGEIWDSLKERSAGAWFGEPFRSERLPLLDEVFDLLGLSLYYDIEIKHGVDAPGPLESDLVALIRRRGLQKHCMISSFNPRSVALCKKLAPEIPTAVIYSVESEVPRRLRHGEGRFSSKCDVLKPAGAQVKPLGIFVNRTLMRYPIVAWTVDSLEDAARLVGLGVTGLISNDPEPLLSLPGFAQHRGGGEGGRSRGGLIKMIGDISAD